MFDNKQMFENKSKLHFLMCHKQPIFKVKTKILNFVIFAIKNKP